MNTWLRCACEPSVAQRAAKYALVVGTILILISYGDLILRGEITGVDLIKMGLTVVLVPYLVSTCSSVGAITERGKRGHFGGVG